MTSQYQIEFMKFLADVKSIGETENAAYKMSSEFPNVVELSGEIVGKDTQDKIIQAGQRYGSLVLADNLSVLVRQSEAE